MIVHALMIPVLAVVAGAGERDPLTPAEQASIIDAAMSSLVRVEYTLRYDKADPPRTRGWMQRCPNCGQFHADDSEEAIREERPMESTGFLIAPTRIVTADPLVHPRFVQGIAVRRGDLVAEGRVIGWAKDQNAVFLELSRPLPGAAPLSFDAGRKGPFLALTCQKRNAVWTGTVQPFNLEVSVTEGGERFCATDSNCLILDRKGGPVALCMKEQVPLDDSWKGSPESWPTLSDTDMAAALDALRATCDRALLRVQLRFRSPKDRRSTPWSYRTSGEEEDATERNEVGVLLDEKTVVVLAALPPKATARLERVLVYPAPGKPVPAAFAHSLRDFGCLLVTLSASQPGAVTTSPDGVLAARNALLLAADVTVRGESRIAYYSHSRIPALETKWKQQVYPQVAGDLQGSFLFDMQRRLVALPVQRRPKVTVQQEWADTTAVLTPVAYIRDAMGDLAKNADPSNVPLSEADENRIAWVGIELQALNKDLARANGVSDQTADGQSGALVTYVYPDSPAGKAGVEAGWVLLRLRVPGQIKPLDVKIDDSQFGDIGGFPWDKLDDVPAQFLDQMPTPWPPAENAFTRALTDLGFGTTYTAEFFHDGKVVAKDFEVVHGPRHYDSATRYKAEALGLTVRDLTYEVRRFFQSTPEDPGVIVSKVEPGGKAAVAGIQPYEVITHVNNQPVLTVKDFQTQIASQGELRLSVKRRTLGRIVKINMAEKTPKKRPAAESRPARAEPADAAE